VPRVTGKRANMTVCCSVFQYVAVCGRLESPATPEHTNTLERKNVGLWHWTFQIEKERERVRVYHGTDTTRVKWGLPQTKHLDPGGLARR